MKFNEIEKFTADGHYRVDVDILDFKFNFDRYINEYGLVLNPDFQRGHVWSESQQIKFVEYILRGGFTSEIRLNQAGWMNSFEGEFVCVDGLQRISAILGFLNNDFKVFGSYRDDFEGRCSNYIGIRVNTLKTRKEVLQWYIELNSGGTVHTTEEINRVKGLLSKE